MLKQTLLSGLLFAAISCYASSEPAATSNASRDAESEIRAARAELNAALVTRDASILSKYWHENVHTTDGGGALWVGRAVNTADYAKMFASTSFVSGVRTPESIDVASGGPNEAAESGRWQWQSRKAEQLTTHSGRYLVMWQKVDGRWLIRSELYVTTGCSGGKACGAP
jgi:ketosteroid isomerase-like protein